MPEKKRDTADVNLERLRELVVRAHPGKDDATLAADMGATPEEVAAIRVRVAGRPGSVDAGLLRPAQGTVVMDAAASMVLDDLGKGGVAVTVSAEDIALLRARGEVEVADRMQRIRDELLAGRHASTMVVNSDRWTTARRPR